MSATASATVVLCVGNPFRRDDGVAAAVAGPARRALPPEVRVMELDGEPARVVEAWAGAGLAVVVDAARSGAAPGTIRRIEVPTGDDVAGNALAAGDDLAGGEVAGNGRVGGAGLAGGDVAGNDLAAGDDLAGGPTGGAGPARRATSSHGGSLSDAVRLGRALGRMPGQLVLYAVEGGDFADGPGLSGPVARAVPGVTARLVAEVAAAGAAPGPRRRAG
ncbi:MAG TPA: hydrogenase maturation protease [Acidimicrobiales bacterium]|nr:hydrogenase maturation protease [Acidimicrobiales bacterium]